MKERTSGNDVIKSSFDAKISDILARLETKAEREEVEVVRESSEVAVSRLEERMVERCDKLTEQQDQFAQIFSRVEESIKVKMIAECLNFQSLNFKIHPM